MLAEPSMECELPVPGYCTTIEMVVLARKIDAGNPGKSSYFTTARPHTD